ncbi:MAG TPA: hypothetical protein VL128_00040 [Candidatus Eisenbacteria bacterium]|nr:hypothetical protein [Candidatus Eisenbacteria bacterium]
MKAVDRAQARGFRLSHRLIVSVAVALSLASLLFLLQVVPHTHPNGQENPTCGLCQAAHAQMAPAVSALLLSLVLLYFGEISVPMCASVAEASFSHFSSRAPPTLFA